MNLLRLQRGLLKLRYEEYTQPDNTIVLLDLWTLWESSENPWDSSFWNKIHLALFMWKQGFKGK